MVQNTRRLAAGTLLLLMATTADAQLIGLYRFDNGEVGGTLGTGAAVPDSSPFGNHGSVVSGTIDLVAGPTGFGTAAQFGGDRISAPLPGVGTSIGDFAIAFWIKAGDGAADQYVLTRDGGNPQTSVIYGYLDDHVELYGTGGPSPRTGSAINLSDDNWHHIVYTRTGSDYSYYFDAVKTDIGQLSGNLAGPEVLTIGSTGNGDGAFTGALDDVALFGQGLDQAQVNSVFAGDFSIFETPLRLVVDRATGQIGIENDNPFPTGLKGYSIRSAAGALSPTNWKSITENYDMDSQTGTVVDANGNWTALTNSSLAASTELSEYQFGVGDGGAIPANTTIWLGEEAWLRGLDEDLTFEYVIPSSLEIETGIVTFVGNSDSPYFRGDLDFDNDIDVDDWTLFAAGMSSDVSSLTRAQAYRLGDLNRDGEINLRDLRLFKSDFDAYTGTPGAFQGMLAAQQVPEPASALVFLSTCVGVAVACYSRRTTVAMLLLVGLGVVASAPANAQLQALYRFEADAQQQSLATGSYTVGDSFLDSTGRENNASVFTGTVNLVAGQGGFGNAAQFGSGMASALLADVGNTVGDFTVAFWMKVSPTPGAANAYYMVARDSGTGAQISAIYDFVDENVELFAISGPNPRPGSQLAIANDSWHHVVYTRTGDDYDAYFNGVKTDVGSLVGPFTSTPTTLGIGGSVSQGGSNMFHGLLDDVAWFGQGVNQTQVNSIMAGDFSEFIKLLDLEVNTTTGSVWLKNRSGVSIDFDGYQILSASNSLDVSAWHSLADQNFDPVGSAPGESWTQGGGSHAGDVSEGLLLGQSTLGDLQSVSLGKLYDTTIDGADLIFRFNTDAGILRGNVVYVSGTLTGDYNGDGEVNAADYVVWRNTLGNTVPTGTGADGNGNGVIDVGDYGEWKSNYGASLSAASLAAPVAVPEPASVAMLLIVLMALPLARLVAMTRRCQLKPAIAALATLSLFAASPHASALGLERDYELGDNTFEQAVANTLVGSQFSGTADEGLTFDSDGSLAAGTAIDLERGLFEANNNASYISVSDRPGAGSTLGVRFDGNGDYLFTDRLGLPETSITATLANPPRDYQGITNRGLQFWAKPGAAGQGSLQSLVLDTNQHGVLISPQNTWVMRYGGTDVDSGVAVDFDSWAHLMLVRPAGSAVGAQLYLNGVAIAARAGGYNGGDDSPLVLGANTGANPGTTDFYTGVLDDLTLFVFGQSTTGTNYGAFDYANDNAYALANLTGVAGDVTQAGGLTIDDLHAFVAGWNSENLVNGIRIGDRASLMKGDLNFDGITDLKDAILMDLALTDAGLSGALAFGADGAPFVLMATVPEPATWGIAAVAVGLLLGGHKRLLRREA